MTFPVLEARLTDPVSAMIVDFYERLWRGDGAEAVARYLSPSYVEHQYTADFSLDGLLAYVESRRAGNAGHAIIIHQTLVDHDFVFLMAEENLGSGVDYARAELFRVDPDGLIAEHWSAQVLDEKNRRNDNGTFSGSRVDRSRNWAAKGADRFEELDQQAFTRHDLTAFRRSRGPEYVQHSPKGRDGLEGLEEVLEGARDAGMNFRMDCIHTLKDGDFLVSHRIYDCDPPWPLMNHHTFDIFRLNEHGRAVEHWDVMDPIDDGVPIDRLI